MNTPERKAKVASIEEKMVECYLRWFLTMGEDNRAQMTRVD